MFQLCIYHLGWFNILSSCARVVYFEVVISHWNDVDTYLCWTADILLHWVRIFLYRVTDERLGFSGFYNLSIVTVVTWYSIDSTLWFLVWLLIYICSKYWCTSVEAARLQSWSERQPEERWWQLYDFALANVFIYVMTQIFYLSCYQFLAPLSPFLVLGRFFLASGLELS